MPVSSINDQNVIVSGVSGNVQKKLWISDTQIKSLVELGLFDIKIQPNPPPGNSLYLWYMPHPTNQRAGFLFRWDNVAWIPCTPEWIRAYGSGGLYSSTGPFRNFTITGLLNNDEHHIVDFLSIVGTQERLPTITARIRLCAKMGLNPKTSPAASIPDIRSSAAGLGIGFLESWVYATPAGNDVYEGMLDFPINTDIYIDYSHLDFAQNQPYKHRVTLKYMLFDATNLSNIPTRYFYSNRPMQMIILSRFTGPGPLAFYVNGMYLAI